LKYGPALGIFAVILPSSPAANLFDPRKAKENPQ